MQFTRASARAVEIVPVATVPADSLEIVHGNNGFVTILAIIDDPSLGLRITGKIMIPASRWPIALAEITDMSPHRN